MSRKKRFISLSKSEIITLEQGHKNGKSYQFRDRCQCLLLSHQGYETKRLKEIFQVSLISIYKWFDKWESQGIVGLMNRSGQGRKPKLSLENEQHVKAIEKLVDDYYHDVDRIRIELEKQFDLSLSPDTVKRYLKKITFDGVAFDVVQKKDKIK